jgi:hypothetical protein
MIIANDKEIKPNNTFPPHCHFDAGGAAEKSVHAPRLTKNI